MLLLHRRAIRHELRIVFLPFGIFEGPFLSARTSLPDAEEDEGAESNKDGGADGGRDSDFRRVRERVPLLAHGLRGRGVVVTVEGEGFGGAVK
jgi:hypothetical protein